MTTPDITPEPEAQPEPEAKGLRAQNDQLRQKVRDLEAKEALGTITGLGLNPETGIGLVLTEKLDKGDLALDGIAAEATKYGHVVPDAQPVAHPQAQQIQTAQAALDNVGATAGSIAPPSRDEVMAQAEVDKDFNTTLAGKGAQLTEMLRNK